MKKRILISFILAIVMVFAISAVAFADDPTEIDINSSITNGSVVVDTTGSNVDLSIYTEGKDGTAWHPGNVGQFNTFDAEGAFTSHYSSASNGNYGILGSYVNAVGSADFVMTDIQDFNVMSGNHHYNTVGYFCAEAYGEDAAMNLKSIGSMYVWSEATNPCSQPSLRGAYIEKSVGVKTDSSLTAYLDMSVSTTSGIATIANSNIWGWGINENGTITSNYNGGTRNVSATGDGNYSQIAFGTSQLNFNGFNFGSGVAQLIADFVGGMSGTYTMDAK